MTGNNLELGLCSVFKQEFDTKRGTKLLHYQNPANLFAVIYLQTTMVVCLELMEKVEAK